MSVITRVDKLYQSTPKPVRLILGSCLLGLTAIVLLQGITVSVLVCWLLLLLSGMGIILGLLRLRGQRPRLFMSESRHVGVPQRCTAAATTALPAPGLQPAVPEQLRQTADA
ncbi:hypothetical protein [Botryobacter ruber]|uniref:hypothetical protein n=1 Tax=Botryobacter ruber TaxID=2171629 RepID=UPI000E0BFDE7|nr:hypothetical protein [Botryobacter ruber]